MTLDVVGPVVALVLAALAAGFAGMSRNRIRDLKGDIDDWRVRYEARESDVRVLQTKVAEQGARIGQLESDLRHAEQLATGETHWTALGDQLDEHHRQAMAQWQAELDALAELGQGWVEVVREMQAMRDGDDRGRAR